jgi:hypothetical protein
MTKVCLILAVRHGIPAYVEHTGGGVATIYAGKPDDAGRYAACAGPGTFAHRFYGGAHVGDSADFYVGPDDDGESLFSAIPLDASDDDIADAIARQVGLSREA